VILFAFYWIEGGAYGCPRNEAAASNAHDDH